MDSERTVTRSFAGTRVALRVFSEVRTSLTEPEDLLKSFASKAVVTGDVTQIDLPNRQQSGLAHAMRILRPIEEIHFTFFDATDVVRNPLIKKIIHVYESDT